MTDGQRVKAPKFKVGDSVLFADSHYNRREGVIVAFVTEERERFNEIETSFHYKLTFGWFSRSLWVDETDVKGAL